MSSKVNLRRIRKNYETNICLCGILIPMDQLNGTPESVELECLNLMKELNAKKGSFILCPGGEIIKGTPVENIDALIFSVFKY
ncbi:MAG: uroporphyrinogen decarboxylase family protein [Actinomycetota bacterium]|nr:uroporphyrinogen decarboxylase family protein [Actinomycetota bacterium]